MKKLFYVFAIVFGTVLFSCNESDDPSPLEDPSENFSTDDDEIEESSGTKGS